MKNVLFKKNEVAAIDCGAMETVNHFKNGLSPKRRMGRVCLIMYTLFLSCMSVYAQDVITLRNGNEINAKVTEVTPSEIRYTMPEGRKTTESD